ncbi:MAG: glgP [Mycobacterium sp.]|jgi:starch phosphorylase|nr:glgP [Mycobacterium sp.]MCW2746223.1 glgP [Mycobacterium sp.]
MRATRRFTVRAVLPEPLAGLSELVLNLRWVWHPPTRDLFEAVDPDLWRSCGHDPVRLLGAVSSVRLSALARDAQFVRRVEEAHAELQDYLTADRWYQTLVDAPAGIAYYSMEYGITEVLPQYSGGLGILAGDHLKTASDLGIPIIGLGLLYQAGYFVQSLNREGWQQERYPGLDPNGLPLAQLQDADGQTVKVTVQLPEHRSLVAQVWVAQVGRVPLLLLDTDIEDNPPELRGICDRLYGGNADHRLHQEVLLGIGGTRALRRYSALTGHPAPDVFHLNEGHAGFAGVERIREFTEDGLDVGEALQAVRAGTVFTTHTPVPAGIDRFPRELVAWFFGAAGGGGPVPAVPVEAILALGAEPDPNVFNMAHMGLRLAARANGVSRLHGEVSREMFASLFPGFDPAEVPIGSVTNGVHAPTWIAREVLDIAERQADPALVTEGTGWDSIAGVPDDLVWSTRRLLRSQLVDEVRRRVRESWLERGAAPSELGWVNSAFDPDVLTIGFARRVPSYKRLTLMLREPERLRQLLLDPDRPIQIVVAGKSHPADEGGKRLIQQLVRFADTPEVRHRIAFLPNYDISMARHLYTGCDIWLNNPLRPLEACGTSGMKAALNGGLNLSIRDGWWDEMYDGENGWAIPSAEVDDPERRDDLEAAALYELLENHVKPAFYERDRESGLPARWVAMVRHTLISLGPQVLSSRMLRDYVRDLYVPAGRSSRQLTAKDYAEARELAAWVGRVRAAWPQVHVLNVDSASPGDTPELGDVLTVGAVVQLGDLGPDDVRVEVAYGRVDEHDDLHDPEKAVLTAAGAAEGEGLRYEGTVTLNRTGAFGYTVRVLPSCDLLASSADLGLIVTG